MGSISSYETSKGRRYRAHFRDADRRNREKAGFVHKRDAEAFLADILIFNLRGQYVDTSDGKLLVGNLGNAWLANQSHLNHRLDARSR